MEAIVHIGLPKTGTTSIQTWLAANAAALAAQGVTYDRMGFSGPRWRKAHVELSIVQADAAGRLVESPRTRAVYGVTDLASQRAFVAGYAEALAGHLNGLSTRKVVFSCEDIGITARGPQMVTGLDRVLNGLFDRVTYVAYLRRQDEWLLSRYSEALRAGETRTCAEYIESKGDFDYFHLMDLWRRMVGTDRIVLRLLEPDVLRNGDLLEDFAAVIGVDPAGFTVPARMNESLSVPAAELVRQMNLAWPAFVGPAKAENPLRAGLAPFLTRQGKDDRKLRLPSSLSARVRLRTQATNEALRAAFFPERADLFPPRPTAEPVPDDVNTPTAEELCRIALDLVRALRMDILKPVQPEEKGLVRRAGAKGPRPAKAGTPAERPRRPSRAGEGRTPGRPERRPA